MAGDAYLLSVTALDETDHTRVLRFSDAQYDGPNRWMTRLQQPAFQATSAATQLVPTLSARGDAVLINNDGKLDYLADYAVDGRAVHIQFYNAATDSLSTVLRATAQNFQFDNNTVTLVLRDPRAQLDVDYPQDIYAGNNALPAGVEGTADDIKGEPKPVALGDVRSVPAVQVNTSRLIYQVSSLADCVITDVYDQGNALTDDGEQASLAALEASTPASGEYTRFQGYFKLGVTPIGQITADATQTSADIADVFETVVTDATDFTVNAADLAALPAYDVGLYLVPATRVTALLDTLAASVGGYWWVDGTEVRVRALVAPSSPARNIRPHQVARLTRVATASGSNGLPLWRVSLEADGLGTVQNVFAAAVGDALRARLSAEYRRSVAEDAGVQTRHLLSTELVLRTALRNTADSDTEAARLLALLMVRRDVVDLDVLQAAPFAVADQVRLFDTRFGYSAGRNFIVLSVVNDVRNRLQTLRLWG